MAKYRHVTNDPPYRTLVTAASAAGWRVEDGRGKHGARHVKLYPPSGTGMVSVPCTSSSRTGYLNCRSKLRGFGLDV